MADNETVPVEVVSPEYAPRYPGGRLKTRGGLDLLRRAVEQGWPLTPEKRKEIIEDMAGLAHDGSLQARDRISAARVLVAADNVNVRREAIAADADKPGTTVQVSVQVTHECSDFLAAYGVQPAQLGAESGAAPSDGAAGGPSP